jgi:probable selenium-dependent hydroxylase accessory protein YqeC
MCKVIVYVGAGGKTSSILEEADRFHAAGKRVVVTTTTHMRSPRKFPEGTDRLTQSPEEAAYLLKQGEVVWYGHLAENRKFSGPFPDEPQEWEAICRLADVILVEADGSKRLPVKIPASHEPVIPPNTDRIIIVMGMSGLHHPIGEVCHRLSLVLALLGKEETDVLTEADYGKILLEGYIRPLQQKFPSCEMAVYLNQVTDTQLLEAAKRIGAELEQKMPSQLEIRYVNHVRALKGTI